MKLGPRNPPPRLCFICKSVIRENAFVLDRSALGGSFEPNEAHWNCFVGWKGRRSYADAAVRGEISRAACDPFEAIAFRDDHAVAFVGRSTNQARMVDVPHGVWADFPLENWRCAEPFRSMFSCNDAMEVVLGARDWVKSHLPEGMDLHGLCDWGAKERMLVELGAADESTREHVARYERSMVQALEGSVGCPHCGEKSTSHRIVRQVNWIQPRFTPDPLDGRPILRTFVERKLPHFACVRCGGSFSLEAVL